MDVLLLTPIDPLAYQIIPDLGLMYLAASLREAGFEVDIRDCRRLGWSMGDLAAYVREVRPLVVGIKSHTNEAARVGRMADVVRREHPSAVIAVGGPHPSMNPKGALSAMPGVDFAFIGEAEISFPLFVRWIKDGGKGTPPQDVHGIAWREEGRAVIREPRFVEDLDQLPLPAWDLMPPDTYPDEAAGIFVPSFPAAPMMLSRGCPFQCAYCGCRYISGTKIRYRSPQNVLQEIDLLEREYHVKSFTFVDDNFTWRKKSAAALFEALAQKDPRVWFTFPNGVRSDSLDLEMIELMERAGCYLIGLGIESGVPATIKRMNRAQMPPEIRKTVQLIRQSSNIQITGFFILGYPGETFEEVKQTISFAKSLPIHHAHFSQFMPIPGTPVYEEMIAKGLIKDNGLDLEMVTNDKAALDLPGLPSKKLLRLQRTAYMGFYLTPWRMINFARMLKSPGMLRVILRRFLKLFW